jgi:hypothetical protein
VRRDEHALFVTLTWHEKCPSPEEAKAAFDRFWKRISRTIPGVSCIWKLEPQERGFPHFHLFLYGVRWLNIEAVCEAWHDCTDEVSEQHRKSGVDVEWVRNDGKLQAYLSKYFSKTYDGWPDEAGEDWEYPGRFWGVRGRDCLPVAEWADWRVQLSHHEAAYLIRYLIDEWEVDTGGVLPPRMTVNTRGDPEATADELLDLL